MGFPLQCIIITLLYSTLSSGTNLGPSSVCHLLGDATNDRKWSFHSFTSQTVDNPMLYEATTYQQLLPLPSLLIISSFLGIIKVTCLFLPAVYCFSSLHHAKPL